MSSWYVLSFNLGLGSRCLEEVQKLIDVLDFQEAATESVPTDMRGWKSRENRPTSHLSEIMDTGHSCAQNTAWKVSKTLLKCVAVVCKGKS